MFFLDRLDLDRRFKLLRRELEARGVNEELRGWCFDSPPVEPPSRSVLLSVSELAGRYCQTMRDIYLRRVLNIRPPPSIKMARGIVLHVVNRESLSAVKRLLFSSEVLSGSDLVEDLLPLSREIIDKSIFEAENLLAKLDADVKNQLRTEALAFFRFLAVQAAARVDQAVSKYPHSNVDSLISIAVPPVVERKVDGSLVGLSRELSVDIYTPFNAIADLKTGEVREFHPYAATGYALAMEAEEGVPVDFGFVIYVQVNLSKMVPSFKLRYFVIGDELRREFLELRDEAFEVVSLGRDPGRPSKCPSYCPYYAVCERGIFEAPSHK
ncbi:type I-A CRISPR-associated protein Cas4/Csa1 [Candidatus Bathyarchaeota archaeon]|nr:type I-A CRISPR-associated protein Cas4/Csa1 [Candidatus Bathyarchaeota archaeon]MBS7618160.1 type I-A CRISPR-associated protein Cas4/Csa1 [Candidatus Bathyarchaeota archaeon]